MKLYRQDISENRSRQGTVQTHVDRILHRRTISENRSRHDIARTRQDAVLLTLSNRINIIIVY